MNTTSSKLPYVVLSAFLAVGSFQTAHARAEAPVQGQAAAEPAALPPDGLPEAPGKAILGRVCTVCHATDYITETARSVQVWRDTLDVMKSFGAVASDDDWKAIADYLIAYLAHANVNKVTAEEIRLVFDVSDKVAQNVIAYRDKQGGFKTIEDLKQAPDLDPKKIDALKPRLIFDSPEPVEKSTVTHPGP